MEGVLLDCAVVDDSSLQRLAIVKMIKDHPNLRLVAEYNNAIEGSAINKRINVGTTVHPSSNAVP